ncbi:MAG: hypothetical protein AAGA75_25925 [Cyanobacteria bacterium P01_E01_bin.6]
MSQAELLQQAQQGNTAAIARLLHLSLYTRGIRVKAHQAPDRLQLLLEANRFPDRHHLVTFIHRGIAKLQVKTFKTVEIYARHPGTTQFLWCDGFDVNAPIREISPSPATDSLMHNSSNSGVQNGHRLNEQDTQVATHGRSQSDEELGCSAHLASSQRDQPGALSPLAQMSPQAIAQQAHIRMSMQSANPALHRRTHQTNDLGWMLVEKFRGVNPFAMGLIAILALHSIIGSRHYTPEGFIAARDPMMMFLHNINLIIHEAGHPIFGIIGQFMGLLGGSLMQVLVPGVIAGYFLVTRQGYAWAIALWWTGQSILDVSFYIKDAQERALPLLGGEAVLHDWHFLLLKMQLLAHDDVIAGIVYTIGIVAYIVAIPMGTYYAYTQPKPQQVEQ